MRSNTYKKAYIQAYKHISGEDVFDLSEVPDHALEYMTKIPIRCLLKPLIYESLDRGLSIRAVARKFDIPPSFVNYTKVKRPS